jgi:hypothetical protein
MISFSLRSEFFLFCILVINDWELSWLRIKKYAESAESIENLALLILRAHSFLIVVRVVYIVIYFLHLVYLLGPIIVLDKHLIEFLYDVILKVEDLPTQRLESLTLLQEVCKLWHVPFIGWFQVLKPLHTTPEQLEQYFHWHFCRDCVREER